MVVLAVVGPLGDLGGLVEQLRRAAMVAAGGGGKSPAGGPEERRPRLAG
ncbi:hypothetical protein ABT023_24790 [Micromonospora sp. NPDC002296]